MAGLVKMYLAEVLAKVPIVQPRNKVHPEQHRDGRVKRKKEFEIFLFKIYFNN